jgi:hypothetical protein
MPGIRHVLTIAAALVMVAIGIPAGAATRHAPRPVSLQASDFRFCAASASACLPERDDNNVTTVPVGTRVTWTYTDRGCDVVVPCPGHNVVFTKGFGSKRLVKTDGAVIYRMTFTRAGRYSYFCTAHQSFGMTGTIVVTKH